MNCFESFRRRLLNSEIGHFCASLRYPSSKTWLQNVGVVFEGHEHVSLAAYGLSRVLVGSLLKL